MPAANRADWVRRLAPLTLDGEPLADQLRRRFGVVVVATLLLGGFMGFFLTIFASFGRWGVGLVLDLAIAPWLAWIWLGHLRLRRWLVRYRHDNAAEPPRPV